MATVSRTLKLPFLWLNQSKRDEFARLQSVNTTVANGILGLPKPGRKSLSTSMLKGTGLGSAWLNQTIRNAKAKTKVKQFKCLPLETNNQNWKLHKVGDTYSVSFAIVPNQGKRVPLAIHAASHQVWLDRILSGQAKQGSIKLCRSRRGIWYALLSVSMGVPDASNECEWIGVDRGQKIPAVAALPNGRGLFFKANRIAHIRKQSQLKRKKLQKAGKHRLVKKLESRERRQVTHINHCISKAIVSVAARNGLGIRLEDLTGIRKAKQRKKTKSDASKNRDTWSFYQIETFIGYKAGEAIVPVESIPAHYTSKTHHVCGHIGARNGFDFYCGHCDKHEHADLNAGRNIGTWIGKFCAVDLNKVATVMVASDLPYAVYDSPPSLVNDEVSIDAAS